MATYYSNVWGTPAGVSSLTVGGGYICGRVSIPAGTAVATGDVLNLFVLRAGSTILGFHGESNAWGDAVPGTLGHTDKDGGSNTVDLDSVIADVDLEDADVFLSLATPLQAPFGAVAEDVVVKVVIGSVTNGASAGVKYLNFAALIGTFGNSGGYAYTWNGTAALGTPST